MSFFGRMGDYLKPWEMIKGAWEETKTDAKSKGKRRHDSVFSGFGKLSDPLTGLLGKGYTNLVHEKIPRTANGIMEPFVQFGHNTNPLYWYGKRSDNDKLNAVHDFGTDKGADVLAAVLGAVYGGGALIGGAGGAGGGATGGGTAAGGGNSWANPNTYMQFANAMPQPQQQQPPPSLIARQPTAAQRVPLFVPPQLLSTQQRFNLWRR